MVKEVVVSTQQCHFVHLMVIVVALGRIMTLSFKMFLLCTIICVMLTGHYLVNMITCV